MLETRTILGKGGRLVIPAAYRKALGVVPGDELIVILEQGELRIMTPFQAVQRAQAMVNLGVEFAGTDLAKVANAMGGHGVDVSSRAELGAALSDAFDRNTFTLICADIGRNAYDGRI